MGQYPAENLNYTVGDPRYVVETFPESQAVDPQEVPLSRLLAPKYQVVPFDARREAGLRTMVAWRDSSVKLGVMLIRGPGGQGKTRFAQEFAARSATRGWQVARGRHISDPVKETAPNEADSAARGRLIVVDYADRWPVKDLRRMFADRFLSSEETPVRVLMLARTAGTWWRSLNGYLEDFDPFVDEGSLPPLAGPTSADRTAVFAGARDSFAKALGVGGADLIRPPDRLGDPLFGMALSLHMAALAAVDAHARGQAPPADPGELSRYLMRREYAHWERMRDSDRITIQAPLMAKVAFTATLIRPLRIPAAREVLVDVDLAGTAADAATVLADHETCYPPTQVDTTLEPLYPDRFGEDFVALHLPDPADTSDSTNAAYAHLLRGLLRSEAVDADTTRPALPAYAGQAVTLLIDAASRWPHVADQLYALLRRRPELGFAAGSNLARLAEIPDVDLGVLEALEASLPHSRHDLDLAAAAIAGRLSKHRLPASAEPKRAELYVELASLYGAARLYEEALVAAQNAVEINRRLGTAHEPGLATALTSLAVRLKDRGRPKQALTAAEEAVAIYRRLADADLAAHGPSLASALNDLGNRLSSVGRDREALNAVQEATRIYRDAAPAREPELA
jgi:tetratricopeptide (TPR) repeat protein